MNLWINWFQCVLSLSSACARKRTFVWMVLALVGLSIRTERLGVTSFIRAGFVKHTKYRRLLHFFHSPSLNISKLTRQWIQLVWRLFNPVLVNGYMILIADGLKIAKEGRKMPAVKCLHQESQNNSKPAYIMGHSFQAIGMLVKGPVGQFFCVPLISRIHEGLVYSNRCKRTLLDKLVTIFMTCVGAVQKKALLIADAYYASQKIVLPLLKEGHHLLSRVRTNAVAYHIAPIPKTPKRGRPKRYGKKVHLKDCFKNIEKFESAPSPVYGENNVSIHYLCKDLLWRPIGKCVRFVLVKHPHRGQIILMTTLTTLDPIEIIRLYGLRFKIEVSFKQAVHTLGTYAYHFWMQDMPRIKKSSGDQFLHRTSKSYRKKIKRKLDAYHRYVQLGCIAQGLLQYLSIAFGKEVWLNFNSWLRTMKTDSAPSEMVVAQSLRSSLFEFLSSKGKTHKLAKIILQNADLSRMPNMRLTG